MIELMNKLKMIYVDFWYDHVADGMSVTNAFIAVCSACALILMVASIIDEQITKDDTDDEDK